LQYSTTLRAASMPRVPRLIAYMISVPAAFAQSANSWRPKLFGSADFQARSRRRGLFSAGPTESSHWKEET